MSLYLYLFNLQGHIGAYLVLGGVDLNGPHLYEIAAHGSTMEKPFTAMGSGTLAAIAHLELKWKADMEVRLDGVND